VSEISGGKGEATMCVDQVSNTFEVAVMAHVPFKIEFTPEDTHSHTFLPEDKAVITGVRFWSLPLGYNWNEAIVVHNLDFTYHRFELHRYAILFLDDLLDTYDVD
jgi:hypothetical protein